MVSGAYSKESLSRTPALEWMMIFNPIEIASEVENLSYRPNF